MSIDELAQLQRDFGSEIERLYTNYKKDPKSRKDQSYFQKKLQALESLWDRFEATDNKIRTNHGTKIDHPYFTTSYYEKIRKGYEEMKSEIESNLGKDHDEHGAQKDDDNDLSDSGAVELAAGTQIRKPTPPTRSTIPEGQPSKPLVTKQANLTGTIKRFQFMFNVLQKTLRSIDTTEKVQPDEYYQLKINTIQTHWQEIQYLHSTIWNQLDDLTADDYNAEEYFKLEDEIQQKLVYMYEKVKHCGKSIHANPNTKHAAVKLPKVVLPKFDGSYLNWHQFRDLFTELVHNQDIADCHKLWYLKTSLLGDAEKLVRHFTTSDANYAAAWKVINDRYENKRLLVTALINKLLSQPTHNIEGASAIKALHDTTQECLLGLQNLDIDTTHWDPLLLHILLKRLDGSTHTLWEQSLKDPRALPSMTDFLKFLEIRFQSLEALGNKGKTREEQSRASRFKRNLASMVATGPTCISCNGHHQLFACNKFLQLSPSSRLNQVRSSKLCINCLKPGHNMRNCTSRGCTKCSLRHNTLLHIEPTTYKKDVEVTKVGSEPAPLSTINKVQPTKNNQSASLMAETKETTKGYVLLGTVMVSLSNDKGISIECRAILDSGSQLNFITEKVARKLQLKGASSKICIEGIGQRKHKTYNRISATLQSRINGYSSTIEAHILPQIVSPQPAQLINISTWPIPNNIILADPHFNQPKEIDLLIGAEMYYSILAVGQLKLSDTLPILQNTVFGWTVSGKIQDIASQNTVCGICTEDERLSDQVEKFWRLEDVESNDNTLTSAERQCERHFHQNYKRDSTGRFIVRLPMREEPRELGESKDMAYSRYLAVERKFNTNEQLREEYSKFMEEYQQLGHMKEVNINEIKGPHYFLPHHAVMKPESSTTKLRVVFDASAKTSTATSLNDILHVGPVIQDDVFSVLLRFRCPKYVFTADIEKMYRQIRVHEEDQNLQLIWWRKNRNDTIRCFKLTTVTYGTACAPYLAIKCLQTLAEEEADKYPAAMQIIKQNFYVDDVLAGSNNLSEAIEMQTQLQALLKRGGFRLRKWCANHAQLLKGIHKEDQELQSSFDSGVEEHIKTMGLIWSPNTDVFRIKYTKVEQHRITKRTVVSDIAHLFDPLGIMGPVVVVAKIFLQKLWALKIHWDAALPQEHHTYWSRFKDNLNILNEITFPRHVYSQQSPRCVQLHIFTDASEKAFGAAAYIRSVNRDTTIAVRLLCAKSKVAPLKQQTLPRLELCAAKLGAEMADRIVKDLNFRKEAVFLWTDSEITLAWINSTSAAFQTFVANRVANIQRLTNPDQWRHVTSTQNPADMLSRGITPDKLVKNNFWFYGPTFLYGPESTWPALYVKKGNCSLEMKKASVTTALQMDDTHFISTINHKNSFKKIQRIMAYLLRFINASRGNRAQSSEFSVEELDNAEKTIIRTMQAQDFKEDLNHLKQYGEAPKNSPLASLTPFMDHENIMRVGGRLEASNLSYNSKHPILLPYSHPLTKILLAEIHLGNLHVGPQALLAITRQKYWPIKGKILARSIVQHCVHCTRSKPKVLEQLMGNLPPARVQPARPFVNAGVDFCGPVWTHFKIRGKRPQKAYIAVFCCFSTKAVHLEIVSDLSTEGFIGALKRFTARRGHCRNIYCDNATNFVGTKNQLQEVREIIESQKAIDKITASCSSKGTDFHFIPPRAPHFGGLWESAVKSAKHLLQSTLAAASLTYEEMETLVTEVEAILNSRPITPMSTDPNDLMALTPGHFLVGEPLTSQVDSHAEPLNANLLTRWKLVTHLKNEFWRRWNNEYLNQLQYRVKWKQRAKNIQAGTMVIIKEDNVPPRRWALGRIVQTFSGSDGLVRVADVRTSTGVLRRPIHKLAPLPIEDNENDPNDTTQTEPDQSKNITESTNDITTQGDSSDRNHEQEPSTSKRRKISMGSSLVTLLITCLLLPITKGSFVEVTSFNNQPGIYFENLGPANIISSEWSLIAYYNMEPYWKEFEYFADHLNKLKLVCRPMHDHDSCLRIINHFQHLFTELSEGNELLHKDPKQHRNKRGAINFIGNIANALFGVLDSNYAEEMSKTIDQIEQNEIHLSELFKNQTSLIDATINIMRKDQEMVQQQFRQLEDDINGITSRLDTIEQRLHQEQLSQLFTSLSIQTMLIASNFYRIQNAIFDVIIDTNHGRISPQLITPAQLLQEINTIKGHLPPSLKLPAIPDDMLSFYNLLHIRGKVETKHIIFKITIPLLASENFELFHIVPVPVKVNNTFIAIQPSFPYLILNLHRDQYYPMNEQELNSCTSINTERHLCIQRHPMYRKGSKVSDCEIKFINQAQQSPSCRLTKLEGGPHWIQLHASNQWIYSLDKKTTINIVCGDNVTQLYIEQAGLLKMRPDCIIKQQLLTIQGHNLFPSVANLSYFPSTNLTENLTLTPVEPILHQTRHYMPHLQELTEIRKRLWEMHSELPIKLTHHDAHQYTVSYISLTIVVIIMVVAAWKCKRKFCLAKNMNADLKDSIAVVPVTSTHPGQLSEGDFVANFDQSS